MLVAEAQTGGRGRLDRTWTSPPRAGLLFSVLLRPRLPASPTDLDPAAGRPGRAAGGGPARRGRDQAEVAQRPAARRRPRQGRRHPGPGDRRRGRRRRRAQREHPARGAARGRGLADRPRAPGAPTGTRCCGRSCAPSPTGTPSGRGATRTGCGRRTRRCATRSGREVRVRLPDGSALAGTATGPGRRCRPAGRHGPTDGDVPVSAGDVIRAARHRPVTLGSSDVTRRQRTPVRVERRDGGLGVRHACARGVPGQPARRRRTRRQAPAPALDHARVGRCCCSIVIVALGSFLAAIFPGGGPADTGPDRDRRDRGDRADPRHRWCRTCAGGRPTTC